MVYIFFFASGFTALIYQLVWTRSAGLALGNTPAALGMVVAVFMGGLALGSAWAGRVASRVRPLRLYGQVEIGIGIFALAVPWLFRATSPIQAIGYGGPLFAMLGIVTSAVLLLPATVLMGTTLPLLVQHVGRTGGAGRLYAVNSAGAALGSLTAGLFLLPRIGLGATTTLAVIVNVAVGLAAIRMGGRAPAPASEAHSPSPLERPQQIAVLVYALSGFAALICEIAWTRALVLSLGSTVYAFALILFAYILGLALGSSLLARRAAKLREPLLVAGAIQILIAAWGAALIWFLGDLPFRIHNVILRFPENFLLLQLSEAIIVLGLILPPTTLMGALLPVTVAVFRKEDGRSMGIVYSRNTIAAIAGTLAATFVLVPRLGVDLTMRLAVGVNLVAALVALWLGASAGRRRVGLTGAAAAAALAAVFIPRWDLSVVSVGMYIYAPQHERSLDSMNEELFKKSRLRSLDAAYWDAFGLVVVHHSASGRFLTVNGKTDASWGSEDTPGQALTAHIPLLLHPAPRDVLVIGLGSGMTLAHAQSHGAESVECVEISPAVVRAAGHFADVNGDACSRPGTRLIVGDGRTHVRYTRKSYDVIASEPSNLWVSGMANLFTVEFLREARNRLKPGGIFAQWVHAYRLSPQDFQGVVRTFTSVFPNAFLWEMYPLGDYLLVGSLDRSEWRIDEIEAALRRPGVASRLAEVGIPDAVHFLARYAMGSPELLDLGRGARAITDDDLWIEYTSPASMLRASPPGMVALLDSRRRNPRTILAKEGLDPATAARLDRFTESRRLLLRALLYSGGANPRAFRESMDAVLRSNPEDALALRLADQEGKEAYNRAFDLQSNGRPDEALGVLTTVSALSAFHPDACILGGWILVRQGKTVEATARFQEALSARPRAVDAQEGLAFVAESQGRIDEARSLLEEAVRWDPRDPTARLAYARFFWRRSEKDRARAEVEQVLRDNPNHPEALRLREGMKSG